MSEKDEILAQLSRDMEENGKFGMIELSPNYATRQFLSRLCTSYVENLKKNTSIRFPNIPLIAAFSIFNPDAIPKRNLPDFKKYGEEKLAKLVNHFSSTLDTERLKSEWDHFKFMPLERAKLLFFVVKFANLWRSRYRRRRGLLKLPIIS